MKTQQTRAEAFAQHGTNLPEHIESPLRLNKALTGKMLLVARFRNLTIEDCVYRARRATKGRIPCNDKATAVALILGAEGKCV